MKSKRTKALDIDKKTKDRVWERDGQCCILCGNHNAMPNAHYISRAQGGLGIEENVVTLCISCHNRLDHTTERTELKQVIKKYLQRIYEDWSESDLIYKKN